MTAPEPTPEDRAEARRRMRAASWDTDAENVDLIAQALADGRQQGLHQRRELIVRVLRSAARMQRAEAGSVPDTDTGTHADGHRCAAGFLDRQADQWEQLQ